MAIDSAEVSGAEYGGYNTGVIGLTPGIELPTISAFRLLGLHKAGIKRYGIMAALINSNGEMLLVEHAESDKRSLGELGPLGETSLMTTHRDEKGALKCLDIEPTANTLLRGIKEELGITVQADALSVSRGYEFFDTRWPVGKSYPGHIGAIRCPITFVKDEVADQILLQPPNSEIIGRSFMPIDALKDDVRTDAYEETRRYRPGMVQWLHNVIMVNRAATYEGAKREPLRSSPWVINGNAQDAVFDRMLS